MEHLRRHEPAANESELFSRIVSRTMAVIGACVALGFLVGAVWSLIDGDWADNLAVTVLWGSIAGAVLGMVSAISFVQGDKRVE